MTTPESIDTRMDEFEAKLKVFDGMLELIINDVWVLASIGLTPEQYRTYLVQKIDNPEITCQRPIEKTSSSGGTHLAAKILQHP